MSCYRAPNPACDLCFSRVLLQLARGELAVDTKQGADPEIFRSCALCVQPIDSGGLDLRLLLEMSILQSHLKTSFSSTERAEPLALFGRYGNWM